MLQRVVLLVVSTWQTVMNIGLADAVRPDLKRRRFTPDHVETTPRVPVDNGDVKNVISILGHRATSRTSNPWEHEYPEDVYTDIPWIEWESWSNVNAPMPVKESQLLATLVPIPLSMIILFLAISWYRRSKSSQRRRRERLRRRHMMELNMIRRQLASQTSNATSHQDSGIGPSECDHRDSIQSLSVFNPPPYSEALDTNLYPLVSKSPRREELPTYGDVAGDSPEQITLRRGDDDITIDVSIDSPMSEHVRKYVMDDSPSTPLSIETSDLELEPDFAIHVNTESTMIPNVHQIRSPPSYNDVFPYQTVSEL